MSAPIKCIIACDYLLALPGLLHTIFTFTMLFQPTPFRVSSGKQHTLCMTVYYVLLLVNCSAVSGLCFCRL